MVNKLDPNMIFNSKYLAAVPSTEKTFRTQMSSSPDGSLLAYCVENIVIVRKQDNNLKGDVVIFKGHKCKTSCVDIAPNGVFAASGDEQGNLKIWFLDDGFEKYSFQCLSSKILGVHWDETSKRILVYGYAGQKGFARYVSWDTCNSMGEITGMTRNVICGDIKRSKPYYAVVASEDLSIRVYNGNNLKPAYNIKTHTKFICDVKFSPKGDRFAVVGLEKKISIYKTETGELLDEITKNNESQHSNGISSVIWLNENCIATCSMDKTGKIWDLNENEKKCHTLSVCSKDSTSDSGMQCSIILGKDYLISLSLNGTFNLFDLGKFKENGKYDNFETSPTKFIYGHQNHVNLVKYHNNLKRLYSSDNSGRISKNILF